MNHTHDMVEAIDRLMKRTECQGDKYIPKTLRQRLDMNEDEAYLTKLRKTMEALDIEIEMKVATSNQPVDLPEVSMQTHHEEKALQNSCEQRCLLPSVAEEAETLETESQ
jgi:hypothetical protein